MCIPVVFEVRFQESTLDSAEMGNVHPSLKNCQYNPWPNPWFPPEFPEKNTDVAQCLVKHVFFLQGYDHIYIYILYIYIFPSLPRSYSHII